MRLRITFSKTGALRFTGHLDLHKVWERTARRAGLPLTYSQGFNPQPRIQIASALPLGFTSQAEVIDLWLNAENGTVSWREADLGILLQSSAPSGLTILAVERVEEGEPALQNRLASAEYEITLLEPPAADLTDRLTNLMRADSLPRERRGRPYDLRPLIERLELRKGKGSSPVRILMRLANREGATGRPEEVLDELGIPFERTRIERTRLIFREKGQE